MIEICEFDQIFKLFKTPLALSKEVFSQVSNMFASIYANLFKFLEICSFQYFKAYILLSGNELILIY